MDDKRKQMMVYFDKFPMWAFWFIIIGVPFIRAMGFGLVLISLGVWSIYDWKKKKVSDIAMDAWIEDELKVVHERALTKTGTDRSEVVSESVVILGFPKVWQLNGGVFAFKKGEDSIIRFTPLHVTVINFTANQLVAYECDLDLSTGNLINESTDEYFYKDVVSVATKTKTQTITLPSGVQVQTNTSETFDLTTSGGTSIEVRLKDPATIQHMGGGEIPTTRAEKAIQVVRKMLREKKGSSAA